VIKPENTGQRSIPRKLGRKGIFYNEKFWNEERGISPQIRRTKALVKFRLVV
jgi:hypothetical protein